jgi:hypothetical protein
MAIMTIECRFEPHVPIGYVAYPSGPIIDPGAPHASTYVCDLPECQQEASDWVEGITGHPGEFHPFQDGAGS